MNIKLIIAYLGTKYHGFQVQKNAVGVCTILQDAIQKIYGERLPIIGCSRTDSGVHAAGYVANFFPTKHIEIHRLAVAINRFLPTDVRILNAEQVPDDFHARYNAVAKQYIYRLCNTGVYSPFDYKYTAFYPEKLDFEIMQTAAKDLIGTKDFRSFCGKSPEGIPDNTVRTVYDFTAEKNGCNIIFSVTANGFLYKMVRIMVGTLIEIGAMRLPPDSIPELLHQKSRDHKGATAKAKGLTLNQVYY